MGTKTKSILGKMRGKIGNVVVVKWNTLEVVRSLPRKKKKRAEVSEKQAARTTLFRLVRKATPKVCNEAINIGFQLSKKAKMTSNNAAASYHLLNAVVGDYPDYSIDLSKLKFSMPILTTENGWKIVYSDNADSGMIVSWELNPFPLKTTQLDDQAIFVFYDGTYQRFMVVNEGLQRQSMTYTWPLGKQRADHRIHCWLFFVSADKKRVSETAYLGGITRGV